MGGAGPSPRHPETALVAAYMTDFPTVYVERPFSKFLGRPIGSVCSRICYWYCGVLYRRFDSIFALSENGGAAKLRTLGIDEVDVVPLGVEVGEFGRDRRDPSCAPSSASTTTSRSSSISAVWMARKSPTSSPMRSACFPLASAQSSP